MSEIASLDRLSTLEVILSARCNMACAYCYQNAKQARSMEWGTLQSALDRLLASRAERLQILFIGGEPLLEVPLIRRGVAYVEDRLPSGREVAYSLSTNGLLLDRDASRFLAEQRFEVQLSFDGVPAAQDLRGRGTYAILDRLLERLRVEEPDLFHRRLTVAITLLVETLPHLADSVAYFLDKGVATIAMDPAITEAAWSAADHDRLEAQFARVFERSLDHYEQTGRIPVELFRRARRESQHRPRRQGMCGAGTGEMIAVDVDGEVQGCVTFARSYQRLPAFLDRRLEPMSMGQIGAADFPARLAAYPAAARKAEIFDDKQEKHSVYGRCGDCRHFGECSICPISIGQLPGNDDPNRIPDFACAFNLVALDYRDRFPRPPTAEQVLLGQAPVPAWMRRLERR